MQGSILKEALKSREVHRILRREIQRQYYQAVTAGDTKAAAALIAVLIDRRLMTELKQQMFTSMADPVGDWESFAIYFLDWLQNGGAEVILELILTIISALA